MIAHLRGIVHRLEATDVTVEVSGVGYKVTVPVDTWDDLKEGEPCMLWIFSYIREDRFDLFGFPTRARQQLFEQLISIPGIGPKMGIELCSATQIMNQAVLENDPVPLTGIKGIGKKTAEKLLLELKALVEKKPDILGPATPGKRHEYDRDAVAALSNLGYDTQTILRALKDLPKDLASTEERVAAALRSL